eukprot:TRINITY_DN4729_c0_g2_i1.p1 TRINITY_DN4729_c0_g2~~TRINITY_DN4729_c0_g2_i1.p1  ORF type:complete len:597 (+),score=268.38 TRINITY_DN4729_c0_g2_i1:204-1994(+)
MSMRHTRLLTPPPADWDADAEDIGELSGFPGQRKVEFAGQAYFQYVQRKLGMSTGEVEEDAEADEVDESVKEKYEAKKRKRERSALGDDHYEVLGLGELRFQATAKNIKDAYRKMVLKHHPDKQSGREEEIEDETFKAIKRAYEVLSDPERRRAFDSTDPFDDSIPSRSDITSDAAFYEHFGPCFVRNSKWCKTSKVPKLGTPKTPYNEVQQFYRFWRQFQTWRDFSEDAEYDLEEAESREEKRWMQRQNKKQTDKKMREERARLNRLVDTAYALDPRVIAHNEKAENRRKERIEKKKKEKADAAAEEAAEEEARKKEVEAKEQAEVAEKERVKKSLRKYKTKVRQRCEELRNDHGCKFFTDERVEKVVSGDNVLKPSVLEGRLSAFFEGLSGEVDEKRAAELFKEELMFLKTTREELEKKTESMMATKKKKDVKIGDWSADELSLLAKGLRKFPAGTRNRWELVQQLVPNKSVEEIIAKTSEAKASSAASADLSKDAFARWQSKKKTPMATTDTISTRTNTLDRTQPWTADEQVSFEKALIEFYPDDPERWEKIAEAVDRTRNDCVRRFRYLHAVLAKEASSASASASASSTSSS